MEIQFGIVGLGRIATTFAKVLSQVEGVTLRAVGSRDAARAEVFAKEHEAAIAYGSYDAVWADPNVQVVYIAQTNDRHYETARQCLMAGKAVLCEKPFVLHLPQAQELAALAQERGLFCMEAMWTRFMPAMAKARQWIEEGRIGELRMGEAAFCMRPNLDPHGRLTSPALGGGALFDVGVYAVETLMDFFGLPERVQGVSVLGETGVDTATAVTMRFGSGIGIAKCAIDAKDDAVATLCGTHGRIRLHQFYQCKKAELLDPSGQVLETFQDDQEGHGFLYEAKHVRDCLLQDLTQSPRMPLSHTVACAQVFETMAREYGIARP